MEEGTLLQPGISEMAPRVSEFRRFYRVFFSRGLVVFGSVVIFAVLMTAIFCPLIAPYDPLQPDAKHVLSSPSSANLLGTDASGRDTLSRLIYGTRTSLMVGVVALGIAAIIGMAAGLIAGYFGGWTSAVIMRIVDAMMAFPMLLLALLFSALLGGGLKNVMISIGIAMIPGYARLMCSVVLSAKETDYILAGRSLGSSNIRQMFGHILPNCFPPLIVLVTMQIGLAILSEAGLSYLGVGITPPTPSWGSMVFDGYKYLTTSPILSFAPGLVIILVVFSFNMIGDGLRDALDPKLRGVV
jgi:peptide/nickel transport system permease protein